MFLEPIKALRLLSTAMTSPKSIDITDKKDKAKSKDESSNDKKSHNII